MKRVAVCMWLALSAGSAMAAAPSQFANIDAKWKACLDKDGSTPGAENCNDRARAAADAILNHDYSAWLEALNHPAADEARDDAEILKRLVASERAWVVYRDKTCELESTSMLGGTGETGAYVACLYETTKQRVLELEQVRANR